MRTPIADAQTVDADSGGSDRRDANQSTMEVDALDRWVEIDRVMYLATDESGWSST